MTARSFIYLGYCVFTSFVLSISQCCYGNRASGAGSKGQFACIVTQMSHH